MHRDESRLDLRLRVLGRTLEHLGVQTYKRRDTAIAELVANCWDAGADRVTIAVPTPSDYDPEVSEIVIRDDSCGMDETEVQNAYLVVGRDRREAGAGGLKSRKVMGRKGIGKLAGFGIASSMHVRTWRNGTETRFALRIDDLTKPDDEVGEVIIGGTTGAAPADLGAHGTELVLRTLKHRAPLDVDALRTALARRFSRTARGEMEILVNGRRIQEPDLEVTARFPEDGSVYKHELEMPGGETAEIRYYYSFAKTPIRSGELRGFTVYVHHEKTAQAPPFFFNVEATATGQHGTRYVTGAIEVDFFDDGPVDLISTDRQEIDWEADEIQAFREWGEELSRRVLREWRAHQEERTEAWILEDENIRERIGKLDRSSGRQVTGFLRKLGRVEGEHYEHYRAILERHIDDPSFARKEEEVRQTRRVLESGTAYRGLEARARGLGPQDVAFEDDGEN